MVAPERRSSSVFYLDAEEVQEYLLVQVELMHSDRRVETGCVHTHTHKEISVSCCRIQREQINVSVINQSIFNLISLKTLRWDEFTLNLAVCHVQLHPGSVKGIVGDVSWSVWAECVVLSCVKTGQQLCTRSQEQHSVHIFHQGGRERPEWL